MNPAVVEVKPRWCALEGRKTGEDVFYHGLRVGVVTQLKNGEWLPIPTGTKKAAAYADLPRYEKRIDAISHLADVGAERMARGVEGAA